MTSTTNDWINGKFEETDNDYKIAGKWILYKNEIEYLPKGVELLYQKLKPKSVLEFGFGMGWTATEFQKQGVQRHVILEPNKENYQMALEWKKQYNTDIEIKNIFSWEFEPKEDFDLIYDDKLPFKGNDDKKTDNWMKENLKNNQWYTKCAGPRGSGKSNKLSIDFELNEEKYRQQLRIIN